MNPTISIDRKVLSEALATGVPIISPRASVPIFGNVLIDATENSATLTATDLEMELTTRIPAAASGPFRATIPAKKLATICSSLESPGIAISFGPSQATLTAGGSRFRLNTLPDMDFPLMSAPEGSDLDGSGCPSESLAEALAHVAHAMGVDDVRYYLNGALMSVSEGRATFVATNGHVLAKAEMELPIPDGKVIMPRQFVYACIRALKISPRDVYIRILHGAVSARIGETSITARAIQGEFPDWRRVIPGYSNDGVTIPKAALLAVLAHAKFLATDDMRSISVSFSPGSAKFSVEDKGGEDMEDMIDIEYSGAPVTISLNIRYLHGATDATRGQNVDIGFGDAQSAVIISAVPRAANVAVIMPMRK